MGAPKWVPTYNQTHAATHANNRKTKTEGYDYMFLFDAHYKRATRSNTNITDNTASHNNDKVVSKEQFPGGTSTEFSG